VNTTQQSQLGQFSKLTQPNSAGWLVCQFSSVQFLFWSSEDHFELVTSANLKQQTVITMTMHLQPSHPDSNISRLPDLAQQIAHNSAEAVSHSESVLSSIRSVGFMTEPWSSW